jgi:predicted TIM-barrel fold metal-dependent hydrolase
MIIDMEHHTATFDKLQKGESGSGKVCERYWDTSDRKMKIRSFEAAGRASEHIDFMDKAGIDMAVLTTNPIDGIDGCRRWHDFCAGLVSEYPDRFIGLATISPFGGREAFDELDRAVNDLGMKGVHIWTHNEGRPLDSREMWPFYEKVAEMGIPIDVHVTLDPPGFDGLLTSYALSYVMARELDMIQSVLRVCRGGVLEDFPDLAVIAAALLSLGAARAAAAAEDPHARHAELVARLAGPRGGVLEDFPDLAVIMNHFGGGVSAVMERLDAYMGYVGPGCPSLYLDEPLISRPWREYFDKLYFNMAGREAGMATVNCALTTISPRRLMFGTDWPFNYDHNEDEAKRYISEIRKLGLPAEDIDAMLGGNAAGLFGL